MKPYRKPAHEAQDRQTQTDNGGIVTVTKAMRLASGVPCVECPLRRDSSRGFLGGYSAEMYVEILHSPASIACHTSAGFRTGEIEKQTHCTGVAAYRANVGHICGDHAGHTYAAHKSTQKVGSSDAVIGSPEEFLKHHGK